VYYLVCIVNKYVPCGRVPVFGCVVKEHILSVTKNRNCSGNGRKTDERNQDGREIYVRREGKFWYKQYDAIKRTHMTKGEESITTTMVGFRLVTRVYLVGPLPADGGSGTGAVHFVPETPQPEQAPEALVE